MNEYTIKDSSNIEAKEMPTLIRSGGIKNISVYSVTLNYMVCSQE